ncbi:major histocompatibility complex class I-related gene protein-like isoform X1 [Anguilla anguilla]|uniref:major histocompatibility complex class I-related gene protein-like isoform X1 n=1 Tax=Anguilla anguilla TaxID=7936 RepID=UPI0015AD0CFE|nr:major histocompatibility complex class I-related gene protein-like isoform X1 [Anguilla anguilla]
MDWEIGAKMKLKIILTLFCVFGTVLGEIHNLHYIYTALSKPISQPGVYQFAAMGILDDRPIDIYNSEEKVKKPLQTWMKEHNEKDYWEKGTQSRRSKEQWFDVNVKILMERMHQNKSDVHILQWMHGCRVEKTTDGKLKFQEGFDQYGYDGENFLSFDSENMAWVAPVRAAESTKKKWDNVPILSQYTKGYLQTDCVHWLEKFLKYQELDFKTFSRPEVHLFSKKSTSPDYRTLVCLATGFYPKDVSVNILKDGAPLAESDGVASSGVRPNGEHKETYQLRKSLEIKASDTSKYSCRIHHRTLQSPIEESWDGKCHNCDGDNTGAIVGGVVVLLIVLAAVAVGLYFLRKKNTEKEKAAQAHVNGLNQPLCPLAVNGNGLVCESTIPSPEVKSETKGSNGSLGSDDSGKGSATSDGSEEEVNEPLVPNGKQQPQLEAIKVV